MRFRTTPEELARQKIVTPGWHPVEIIEVKEGPDKGKSGVVGQLLTVKARVLPGGKADDVGAVLTCWFSEKAQGTIANFSQAITGEPFQANKDYDYGERNLKGKRMEWYVSRSSYNGKPSNQVDDQRAMQGAAGAGAGAVAGEAAKAG